jgi:pyridoxal phosphate enzyme (YggS family)
VAQLITPIDAGRVAANLQRVRADIADATPSGQNPSEVEVLAAVKYVASEELGALAEAGITLLGENRAQELERKAKAWEGRAGGPDFIWDFIGHLQSRKVRQVLPHVRLIHSVASDSVLRELGKHGTADTEVLVEVNVAGDETKSGIAPAELDAFVERCPARVVGLMTMPPLTERPEDSRRHFAALAQLAADRDLRVLSMGTTQDYAVAVQEGATIVRLGSVLLR